MRIAIGCPTNDMVHSGFAFSLARMMSATLMKAQIQFAIINEQSCFIDIGRHKIVQQALDAKCDYILFIDSDMTFPPDTLLHLLAQEKDIIGVNAIKRRPPYTTIAKALDGLPVPLTAEGVSEVGSLGTGVLLVKCSVFEMIGKPYFKMSWDGESFEGEDQAFCRIAKASGFSIYCHHDLSTHIGHLGQIACGVNFPPAEEKRIIT